MTSDKRLALIAEAAERVTRNAVEGHKANRSTCRDYEKMVDKRYGLAIFTSLRNKIFRFRNISVRQALEIMSNGDCAS